jgi:hypothetical protein
LATPRSNFDRVTRPALPRVTQRLRVVDPVPDGPEPATRELPRQRGAGLRVVLTRYLAVAVILLALVLITDPHDAERGTAASQPWRYQQEQVDVQGGGILNIYSRTTIKLTAWIARGSVERVREVNRLNLLDLLVGAPTANHVSDWRAANGLALERSTKLAVILLIIVGVVAKAIPGRTWITVVMLLLALTFVLTKPQTTVALASAPSTAVPNSMVSVFGQLDPASSPDPDHPADLVQQELAGQYWQSFVANPLSRMQTGSPVLTDASPGAKPGLLDGLRRSVVEVNDWAVGKRGWERAFISTTALMYVVPFSIVVAVLAMIASSAQAVLFLLLLAALVVVPIAVDRRRRPAVFRYWLLPLLGTIAVLAASSLLALAAMRMGQAIHRTDEYVGLLMAGSSGPALLVLSLRLAARRRRRQAAASTSNGGSS